jgi:hypothetical protein
MATLKVLYNTSRVLLIEGTLKSNMERETLISGTSFVEVDREAIFHIAGFAQYEVERETILDNRPRIFFTNDSTSYAYPYISPLGKPVSDVEVYATYADQYGRPLHSKPTAISNTNKYGVYSMDVLLLDPEAEETYIRTYSDNNFIPSVLYRIKRVEEEVPPIVIPPEEDPEPTTPPSTTIIVNYVIEEVKPLCLPQK